MWGFLSALISGALMSIQGVFNTNVTKQTSLWVSTGWVQFSAFLVCVAAWLFTGRESIGALWQVENKYTLLGGIIGAFITMIGTFYTGYKGLKSSHKYFALSSLLCMIMSIYTGHKMISGSKKTRKKAEATETED